MPADRRPEEAGPERVTQRDRKHDLQEEHRTKTGIATPMFAPTIETTVGELRRSAEAIPSGIPTTVANSIARIVSSIVTGIRSTTMSTTGRLKRIELSRSPWRMPLSPPPRMAGSRFRPPPSDTTDPTLLRTPR